MYVWSWFFFLGDIFTLKMQQFFCSPSIFTKKQQKKNLVRWHSYMRKCALIAILQNDFANAKRHCCTVQCGVVGTGKYLSEALIFPSTNPQYDRKIFIELQVQYMKIVSSEHG